MKQDNLNTPDNINDLIGRMSGGDYPDLKVFLHQTKQDRYLPQDFLYVDANKFCKVRVDDIYYCDDCVHIDITDNNNWLPPTLTIYINKKPDFMLVNWNDLQEISQCTNVTISNDDLLEFEF